MGLTPATGTSFTIAGSNGTADVNVFLKGSSGSSAGGNAGVIGGTGTTSGGNADLTGGTTTATNGNGGGSNALGGAGTGTGNGGSFLGKGGNGGASGEGGNASLQAGAGGTSSDNGTVALIDGNGNVAFAVENSANLISAPLTGNPDFNDPFRLGIAAPTFPTGSTTLTLTNLEYALFCIRPTGAATAGGSPTIVFPNAGLGADGWTKILDLTQVGLRSSLTQLNITCGSVSTAISSTTLSAHAVFILSFDGTTISFGQA
jgi:hypothetical protein